MYKSLFTFILILALISCDKKFKFTIDAPEKIAINQKLSVKLTEENGNSFEKATYLLDGKEINPSTPIDISDYKLGRHTLEINVDYDNKSKTLTKSIFFMSDKKPDLYGFKIINTFPHDKEAYTQGLEFHNGFLYESTGQNGRSSLRKVDITSGKVLQKIDLGNEYFAEGMTIFDNKIFQLTWQNNVGFVYNIIDFKQLSTFDYQKSKEGWGLTNDGKMLLKSDGTEKIWFLDPATQKEITYIEAYTNEQKVDKINELEYIDGKIYANVYQNNAVLIINPKNGAIEGVIDFSSLVEEMGKIQPLTPGDEVLNGIAYDAVGKRLFVTGKDWSKLFQIEIFKN